MKAATGGREEPAPGGDVEKPAGPVVQGRFVRPRLRPGMVAVEASEHLGPARPVHDGLEVIGNDDPLVDELDGAGYSAAARCLVPRCKIGADIRGSCGPGPARYR